MKTLRWFPFLGFHIHFISRLEFVDAVDTEPVQYSHMEKPHHLTPPPKPESWMDRFVLSSTVCIARDKGLYQ